MANKNYTKYSNPNVSNRSKEEPISKKENIKDAVIKAEPIKKTVIETKLVENENHKTPTNTTVRSGMVCNCSRLNVRKKPRKDAEIITQIPKLTVVEIDDDKSNNLFYKISTSSGIEGFCMRDYISVD